MHQEAVCQNEQGKKLYIIIDAQQIEAKSTDDSSPNDCVYI